VPDTTPPPSGDTAAPGPIATPGVAKDDPILVVDGVTRSFGGLTAVAVDHLEVERGTITALIGPNGAGKTTLFNLLTGFDTPNSGTWRFDGEDVGRLPSHELARRGMVRTFQLTKSLEIMSVIDNMKLGAPNQSGERIFGSFNSPKWRREEAEIEERADALLERFRLTHVRDDYARTLSGGQRKLLEMARALMTQPRLVMLDEPMAGVNPALTESLLTHIRDLRSDGTTVVFVEHDMDVVMGISDWVVCMAQGHVIAEGTPQDVASNEAVIEAYLGHAETIR
jgi:neutral amino acid transport system ATP-binding protein